MGEEDVTRLTMRVLRGELAEMGGRFAYKVPKAGTGVRHPTISVADPDSSWELIKTTLQDKLKNASFDWNGRTLKSVRFEFCSLEDPCLKYHISSPLDSYKIPYLNVYVSTCDRMETYKNISKTRLKAWIEDMKHPTNGMETSEWIVLNVSRLSGDAEANAVQLAGGKKVVDRMKADFGGSKRFCQLSLNMGSALSSSKSTVDSEWDVVVKSIFASVVKSFELRCRRVEDQVLKLESQKSLPGWNYCIYLILKESLAFMWIQIHQYYDAIRIYDNLIKQFEELAHDVELDANTGSSKLNKDLYQAQVLRANLQNHRQHLEKETSKLSSSSAGKIAGTLSRKLSYSLSFGPKSEQLVNRMRSFTDSDDSDDSPDRFSVGSPSSSFTLQTPMSANSDTNKPRRDSPPSPGEIIVGNVPVFLLDVSRKPYRDQIHKSAISSLEIRLYLFIRSTLLLFQVGHSEEALRRSLHFISTFWKGMIRSANMALETTCNSDAEIDCTSEEQIELVAMSWAISASLEMVCAGQAVSGFEGESFLFISELLAYGASCLERIVRLDSKSNESQAADLSMFLFADKKWLAKLPQSLLLRHCTSPGIIMENREAFMSWIPVGIVDALGDMHLCLTFLSDLLGCRAKFLSDAHRFRSAQRLNLRRSYLYAIYEDWEMAMDILQSSLESSDEINSWSKLYADSQLLLAYIQEKTMLPLQSVTTLLRVLSLNLATRSQRLHAHKLLLKQLPSPECKAVYAGKRYPLVVPRAAIAFNPRDSSKDSVIVHESEILHVRVRFMSMFPEQIPCTSLKVRFKRESIRKQNESSGILTGLVKYQSAEKTIVGEVMSVSTNPTVDEMEEHLFLVEEWESSLVTTVDSLIATIETTTVTPGENELILSSLPVANSIANGVYLPDRMVFTFGEMTLVYEITDDHVIVPVKILSMVSLLQFSIARKLGTLLLADDQKADMMLPLNVKQTFPDLKIISAALSFTMNDERVLKITDKSHFEVSHFENPITLHLTPVSAVESFKSSVNGDLNKKNRSLNRSSGSFRLETCLEISANIQYSFPDHFGNEIITSVLQKEKVALRYQMPFVLIYSVMFFQGQLFFQLQLESKCSHRIKLRNTRLADLAALDTNLEKVIPAMGTLHLVFIADVMPQILPQETHVLEFSTDYTCMLHHDESDSVTFSRRISFEQSANQKYLGIQTLVLNTNKIVVGSVVVVHFKVAVSGETTTFVRPVEENAASEKISRLTSDVDYKIHFAADAWMVTGIQAGTISMKEKEEASIICEFVPLKPGEFSIPTIEISDKFTVFTDYETMICIHLA